MKQAKLCKIMHKSKHVQKNSLKQFIIDIIPQSPDFNIENKTKFVS